MASDYPKISEISTLEKKLMADINNFNRIYSCYLHSSSNPSPNAQYVISNQSSSCPDVSLGGVNAAKTIVIQDIADLNTKLAAYTIDSSNITQSQYEDKFQEIIQKYGEILNVRKDLDTKLAELYGTDNGMNNYYNNKYSATIFSKIMLTIFVTCLLYYTFRKLIKK